MMSPGEDHGHAGKLTAAWHFAQDDQGDQNGKYRAQVAQRAGHGRPDAAVAFEGQDRHGCGKQASGQGEQRRAASMKAASVE